MHSAASKRSSTNGWERKCDSYVTSMYVCNSMVLCSASHSPRLLITLIVISHRFICDCVYFCFLFLISFSFDSEPFVKMWISTGYVCVFSCLLRSLLVLFAALYIFLLWTVFHLYIERQRQVMFELPLPLLSLIHIWRCRRLLRCRSRWSPYH